DLVARHPEEVEAHWNYALVLLLSGDFERGWREHEYRPALRDVGEFPYPRWTGAEDIAGRRVGIWGEQGLGDVIQSVRYADLVAERGAKVWIVCHRDLFELLRSSFAGRHEILEVDAAFTPLDFWCPMFSLPLVFGTTEVTIPRNVPYLKPDEPRLSEWRQRLSEWRETFRVGLVWAGRPSHENDRHRSRPLSDFAPLAAVQGVTFFSLQKGPRAADAANPPAGMQLIDLSNDIQNFADTAAIVANLDLVIAVDTSVVHLAGAMAKPVW